MFRVECQESKVAGLWFRVQGSLTLNVSVMCLGFGVWHLRAVVWGLGCRVWGFGLGFWARARIIVETFWL